MGSFLREVANPPNPYLSTDVEYLPEQEDDVKMARLKVLEDSTREILSSNDSPDIGFGYSVNPYRGCMHACAYCLDGDTPIWMADGSIKQTTVTNTTTTTTTATTSAQATTTTTAATQTASR